MHDLKHLEQRLLEERDRTLRGIQVAEGEEAEGQRESAGALSRVPQHLADAGSETQEAEKDFANIARQSDQLTQIDEALRLLRSDPQAYGKCERCGREIEPKRLEMVPWTRLCAEDARAEEEGGA